MKTIPKVEFRRLGYEKWEVLNLLGTTFTNIEESIIKVRALREEGINPTVQLRLITPSFTKEWDNF